MVHSLTYSLTHLLTYLLTHSFIQVLTKIMPRTYQVQRLPLFSGAGGLVERFSGTFSIWNKCSMIENLGLNHYQPQEMSAKMVCSFAICALTHSLTHSLTHLLTHSLTHSLHIQSQFLHGNSHSLFHGIRYLLTNFLRRCHM